MPNEKLEKLEAQLFGQLGATKNDLAEWENGSYEMDSQTVANFWSIVSKAPAVEVVGDYDCDGICASYIMSKAIKAYCPGMRVKVRVPRRFSEGYGFNEAIAKEIKEQLPKGSVVVTVDNGIAAASALESLEADGYKVIITDHHELGSNKIPNVTMVLDPKVDGCKESFDGDYWCGAAVAYKISEQVVPANLKQEFTIFAGLATMADCMELKKGNWGLVRSAVNMLRNGYIPYSLGMLVENLKQDYRYASEELFSFYLGPAFNAPGRLEDRGAMEMLKYLMKPSPEGAERIVGINNIRKQIRDNEYELVNAAIYAQGQTEVDPIWVYVPNLHEGIVGILAGKVVEDYGVSAIVLTDSTEPGVYKGSARGAVGTSIFNHLLECGDVFERMGGHDGAAGLSIKAENLKEAMSHQKVRSHDVKKDNSACIEIEKEEIPSVSKVVEKFQPFGEGNPAPEFGVAIDMNADNVKMVGKNSEHLILQNDQGGYKITHFFHDPNSLANKSKFELRGQVKKTAFANKEVPTFDAKDAVDIYDDREWGCK